MISMDDVNTLAHLLVSKAKHVLETPLTVFIPTVLRDEQGQIQWGNLLNGVLLAGMVAAGTSLFSMSATVAELKTIQSQRAAVLEKLPALIEQQRILEKELDLMKSGAASATADRFRGSDARAMRDDLRSEIKKEVDRLDTRIDREIYKMGRR